MRPSTLTILAMAILGGMIFGMVTLLDSCSARRAVKTEEIVYGVVAQHPDTDLTIYFSNLEGQETYKWDVGELSRALTRLIKSGRVVTTEKGVKVVEGRR